MGVGDEAVHVAVQPLVVRHEPEKRMGVEQHAHQLYGSKFGTGSSKSSGTVMRPRAPPPLRGRRSGFRRGTSRKSAPSPREITTSSPPAALSISSASRCCASSSFTFRMVGLVDQAMYAAASSGSRTTQARCSMSLLRRGLECSKRLLKFVLSANPQSRKLAGLDGAGAWARPAGLRDETWPLL